MTLSYRPDSISHLLLCIIFLLRNATKNQNVCLHLRFSCHRLQELPLYKHPDTHNASCYNHQWPWKMWAWLAVNTPGNKHFTQWWFNSLLKNPASNIQWQYFLPFSYCSRCKFEIKTTINYSKCRNERHPCWFIRLITVMKWCWEDRQYRRRLEILPIPPNIANKCICIQTEALAASPSC